MKTACIAALFLVGFFACNRNAITRNEISRNPLLGQYELVGHDKSGQTAFTGSMSLDSLEQNHVKGKCKIIRSKVAPPGLLDQDAACEGLLEGRGLSMDLAPSMDDAGLLLEGEITESGISGTWKLDGFVTSEVLGRFEAVKQN